ncbi:MAG TPA: SRPBCC family protein [Methyloceanibacter sp.]|nr:SRPBCC family protein [Methyloceanibacter sp.]
MMIWARLLVMIAATLTFADFPSVAHGPTPQKVEEKIAIAAPPQIVWDAVKDFDALTSWNPLVESSAGSGGNEANGTREVVLKSGGKLIDSLDEYSGEDMSYSYRLAEPNIEAFPVSFYSATLTVRPGENGGSEVEWSGRFYRADTGNFPSEAQNDQAAIDAMTKFFKEGLESLKQKIETP